MMEAEVRDRLLKNPDGPFVLQCMANAPYDGCWHEPNYWLLKDKEVYPLYISGVAWTKFKFSRYDQPWFHGVYFTSFIKEMEDGLHDRYDEWEILDPDKWHFSNYNVLNSVTVLMTRHQLQPPLWECSECKNMCQGKAKFLSYVGNGGIGVFLKDPVCEECFQQIRWCETCSRYVKVDGVDVCPEEDEDSDLEKAEVHKLHPPDDQAIAFGLTGDRFLGPDGDVEGLEGVSVVIMQKGV